MIPTFDSLDVDHAGDVAELELGEHPVEYLKGLVDLLRVVGRRGQALQHKYNTMLKTSDFSDSDPKKFVSLTASKGSFGGTLTQVEHFM